MIMVWPLSDDTNAIMLLYGWFGAEQQPLSLSEYNMLVEWLHRHQYRPHHLIDGVCNSAEVADETDLSHDRLKSLLDRRITLGFYLEEWQRRGYWILGRGDAIYPKRIRQCLGSQAPPLLFGTGEINLLDRGGVAVIGPDPVGQPPSESTRTIANLCAQHDYPTITAGSQEIATVTAENVVSAGGRLVWVLSGRQLSKPLEKKIRHAKASRKIALLASRSPADPRSMPQEPEIGRLLIALCNSAVYVDGTEFSVDPYDFRPAMETYQSRRTFFVWSDEYATRAVDQLLKAGGHIWKNEQDSIAAGLFEVNTEVGSEARTDCGPELESLALLQPVDARDRPEDQKQSNTALENSDIDEQTELPGHKDPSEYVQGELFDIHPEISQGGEIWKLTRNDPGYPASIRASMGDDAPRLILGVGEKNMTGRNRLAIIGPDSIPSARIKKVCEIATKLNRPVIVVGHLRMAREIVHVVHKCSGSVIWILDDEELKLRLKSPYQQALREHHLIMLAVKKSDMSKNSGLIGSLAVGLADEVLYVDGSNFGESSKREDRFGARVAALGRLEICRLLYGRKLSPEGQQVKERGAKSWVDEGAEIHNSVEENPGKYDDSWGQVQLF